MSAEPKPYNPLIVKAWTFISLIVALIIFGMLTFGQPLLQAGHIVWILLRWLASPII
jgi:hypothetical protein